MFLAMTNHSYVYNLSLIKLALKLKFNLNLAKKWTKSVTYNLEVLYKYKNVFFGRNFLSNYYFSDFLLHISRFDIKDNFL